MSKEKTMQEFEKWFNEEPTDVEKGYCIIAWRAALEMVLEECTLSPIGFVFIKEELEE